MNIELQQVKLKNFFSFGSKWQTIPFLRGLNVVIGEDVDTARSNGSGKSSLLESIPYGLFGQVHKNVRKEQIINWKNRKACEVQLDFIKNNNKYKVIRGIKPDVFEIYKNDHLINKPAHVKDYQKILNNILGLNYTTFMSLIHSNINSSVKILSMKKPEKRKFLEKMFGLELYTKLNENSNSKLKNINEKTREIEISNDYKEKSINESNERIKDLERQLKGINLSKGLLNDAQEKLEELEFKTPEIDKDKLVQEINDSLMIIANYEALELNINNKIYSVETWVKNNNKKIYEYKANEKEVEERAKLIKKLNSLIKKNGSVDFITDKIEKLKTELIQCEYVIDITISKISNIKSDIATVLSEIKQKKKEIILLKNDKCPTCGGDLSNGILFNIKEKELQKKYKKKEVLRFKLKENDQEKNYIAKENLLNIIQTWESKRNNVFDLKDKIVNVVGSDIDIKKLEKDKNRYTKTLHKLNNLLNDIKKKLIKENRKFNLLEEKKDDLQKYMNKIVDQEIEIKRIEEKINNEKKLQNNLKSLLEKDNQNIKLLKQEIKSFKIKVIKYNEMKDYLNYIKFICKDENIKQYAISSIIPFLNKYTNNCLSKAGYNFYVTLDKWLEATINGPGITKASYGSLSGGESRGIDVAIQLAFLQIDRLQANVFFDLLVFDELLDSSIDQKGILEIFNIIKNKQKEDNSKLFIISHRSELNEYNEIDNVYKVIKKDGYSKVIIK